jgi:2-polyprenyl-3-methyl-5-hydroxy-6-metoxy-1,4-benzoquinol methylase
MASSDPSRVGSHYNANYGNFETALYTEIRQEAYGEDIGQNSWLTAEEQDRFIEWLQLSPGQTLLDVACGAGGPALRIAAKTGCSVVGVDVHESAVAAARVLAAERGLDGRADFRIADAGTRLSFSDASFDAITCIDAINHLPERARVLKEWVRLLKPGGLLLFTDPITLTGPVDNREIAVRSSAGFYLYVPAGYDERALEEIGLTLLASEDLTANTAKIAQARHSARVARRSALRQYEGDAAFDQQQEFLSLAGQLARERRLSRFVYLTKK